MAVIHFKSVILYISLFQKNWQHVRGTNFYGCCFSTIPNFTSKKILDYNSVCNPKIKIPLKSFREEGQSHGTAKHLRSQAKRRLPGCQAASAKLTYRNMAKEVRSLFPQLFVKLLLVCPVTSCTCEKSFSALRCLKTWLRSTGLEVKSGWTTSLCTMFAISQP